MHVMTATCTNRFEGVEYVRWHGHYYRLDNYGRLDRHGRVSLTYLRDHSSGVSVYPIDVWPAEPHQVESIEWWRQKGVVE